MFLASHDKRQTGIPENTQKTAALDQHREVVLQLPLQSVAGNVAALIHLAYVLWRTGKGVLRAVRGLALGLHCWFHRIWAVLACRTTSKLALKTEKYLLAWNVFWQISDNKGSREAKGRSSMGVMHLFFFFFLCKEGTSGGPVSLGALGWIRHD